MSRIGSVAIVLGKGDREVTYASLPLFAEATKSGKSTRVTLGDRKSSATVPVSVPIELDNVRAFIVETGKGGPVRIDARDGRTTGDTPKPKRHGFANVTVGKVTYAIYPQVTRTGGGDLSLFVRGSEGAAPVASTNEQALADLFAE